MRGGTVNRNGSTSMRTPLVTNRRVVPGAHGPLRKRSGAGTRGVSQGS